MGHYKWALKKNLHIYMINTFLTLNAIFIFIIPFIYVLSISFSNEDLLMEHGYKLIPEKIDLTAYSFVFANPRALTDAYIVTALQSFAGTFAGIVFMALCAYSMSRSSYKLKSPLTFYVFFTMIFSGGLIPTYIMNTQYLHLGNKIWIYLFSPWLVNGFYIIILRTFFKELPPALTDSAKVDGANEIRTLFQIVLPLSTPVLATVALLTLLERWNVWYTTLIYIRDSKLYTLQFLLQKILLEAETFKNMMENLPPGQEKIQDIKIPTESMRYAMCVVAAGPMVLIFPFFQKYFAKGLIVGAVKG